MGCSGHPSDCRTPRLRGQTGRVGVGLDGPGRWPCFRLGRLDRASFSLPRRPDLFPKQPSGVWRSRAKTLPTALNGTLTVACSGRHRPSASTPPPCGSLRAGCPGEAPRPASGSSLWSAPSTPPPKASFSSADFPSLANSPSVRPDFSSSTASVSCHTASCGARVSSAVRRPCPSVAAWACTAASTNPSPPITQPVDISTNRCALRAGSASASRDR